MNNYVADGNLDHLTKALLFRRNYGHTFSWIGFYVPVKGAFRESYVVINALREETP